MQTLGQLYVDSLRSRESLDLMVESADKVECLENALASMLHIVERTALFAAALDASLTAVHRQIDKCKQGNPEVAACLESYVGDLRGLKASVLDNVFSDEAEFSRGFERMVRDNLAKQAGIDPKDEKAVMGYMLKAGRALATTPPPGGN